MHFYKFSLSLLLISLFVFEAPLTAIAAAKPAEKILIQVVADPTGLETAALLGDLASQLLRDAPADAHLATLGGSDIRPRLLQDLLGHDSLIAQLSEFDLSAVHLMAARRAYYQFDFVTCLNEVNLFLGGGGQAEPRMAGRLYTHGLLLKGLCHFASRDMAPAREALAEVIRLLPDQRLNTVAYSPEIAQFYDEIRPAVLAELTASPEEPLSITSDPPFADIFWNGAYIGQTPLTIDVKLGLRHFVELRKPGAALWRARLDPQLKSAMIDRSSPVARLRVTLPMSRALAMPAALPETIGAPNLIMPDSLDAAEVTRDLSLLGSLLEARELWLLEARPKGQDVDLQLTQIDVPSQKIIRHVNQLLVDQGEGLAVAGRGLWQRLATESTPSVAANSEAVRESDLPPAAHPSAHLDAMIEEFSRPSRVTDEKNWLAENPEGFDHLSPLAANRSVSTQLAELAAAPEPQPFYTRWWFWSAVSVLVAGAAVGTALALQNSSGGAAAAPLGNPASGNSPSGVLVGSTLQH